MWTEGFYFRHVTDARCILIKSSTSVHCTAQSDFLEEFLSGLGRQTPRTRVENIHIIYLLTLAARQPVSCVLTRIFISHSNIQSWTGLQIWPVLVVTTLIPTYQPSPALDVCIGPWTLPSNHVNSLEALPEFPIF